MKLLCVFAFLLISFSGQSQNEAISLQNPSFELLVTNSSILQNWLECDEFVGESLPDIQPGKFGCTLPPAQGQQYIAMVTRADGSWERICQNLKSPLKADSIYWFALCLAVSNQYYSATRTSMTTLNFVEPVKLRIWGFDATANQMEILAETEAIDHEAWKVYGMQLVMPDFEVTRIGFEAYFPNSAHKTAGNLLLDNCSSFFPDAKKSDFVMAKQVMWTPATPNEISLLNPSFERKAERPFALPNSWKEPNPQLITPHRVHPFHPDSNVPVPMEQNRRPITYYGKKVVKQHPEDGDAFASLLASSNGAKQYLSTEVNGVLRKGVGYTFSLSLAHADYFRQREQTDDLEVNYNQGLQLNIWGGNPENPKAELLARSGTIQKRKWQRNHFVLKPSKEQYTMITLEAAYAPEIGKAYNGNILIDNCSNIVKIK